MLDVPVIRGGILVDFRNGGAIDVVMDLPKEHLLPQFLKLFLRIRLAELGGDQGELFGVHQQHFAQAIVALDL